MNARTNDQDYVGIVLPNEVFVIVSCRQQFDEIARPVRDHGHTENGHCLTKNISQDGVTVTFQHWIERAA